MKKSTQIIRAEAKYLKTGIFFLFLGICCIAFSQPKPKPLPPPVQSGADGRLVYIPDSLGNRIPDYSYCGYKASGKAIPLIEVKLLVSPPSGDATQVIQSAIDYISMMPLNNSGFRGAILLMPGTYSIQGRLKIKQSGVVLRGSGFGENGTVFLASGLDRETLLRIEGTRNTLVLPNVQIIDHYVPVNAFQLSLGGLNDLKVGSKVFISRPSTKEWIDLLGMNEFGGETSWLGWKPGERDIVWDRTITAIEGNKITLDAPLTTALDLNYGGGTVASYQWPGRIENVGIENIRFESFFNQENLKDEEHCWNAISFENCRDGWVRQCTFSHFAGSAVAVYETASRVTIEDCLSLNPVSEVAAFRRNTFFTSGQQNLFQRLYAEYGYHDFVVGFCAPGPNAFVQCESHLPFNFSGAIDSWASGVLFDMVSIDGHALCLKNREQDGYGAGWTAANSMLWQCSASRIECYRPPGAQNWAFGAWAQFAGNGYWHEPNSHIKPRSLFYAQLADRIGKDAIPSEPVMPVEEEASSSPTVNQAAKIVESLVINPITTLRKWIESSALKRPIPIGTENVLLFDPLKIKAVSKSETVPVKEISVQNGYLVYGNQLITGNRASSPWWSGNLRPRGLQNARPAITRFVPGRTGNGYTDDLPELINWMGNSNIAAFEQNYALWYDRRRDDHERIRRFDADAWAPFYEVPFARSGKELAWDGLSKYDLTHYNTWYWKRLSDFAALAAQQGKLLVHHQYFQHNIIEAGAHWVDSPWRTVNNINNTGFTEPPPFAGDKRIFIAHEFYNIDHPVRRELHRKYIRQCLDNFIDNPNVIQLISAEYTGPLHFVQFWIDVISEWEDETGHDALIGLSTTKDVQDAILADPVRSKRVELIDIRYWASNAEGEVYAPKGGQNLAPRQHARLVKPGKQTFASAYADVWEYRSRFPGKAVTYSYTLADNLAWAVFMAGGSLAHIPKVEQEGFLESASTMQPEKVFADGCWMLSNNSGEKIIYSESENWIDLILPSTEKGFHLTLINPDDGKTRVRMKPGNNPKKIISDYGNIRPVVVWLSKK